MSEKKQPEAAQDLTEAFGEPYRRVMQTAVDTQQRNVQLAQGWVEGLTGVLESQAEANRALTRAMEAYVGVVEEAIRSQERTNRALTESLDAYRDVIERTTSLQEKSTSLVESFFGDVTGELRESMQNSQAVAQGMMEGSQKQMEAFQKLLAAPFALYQKNLEALGRQGE